jgi:type VI secretion system protein ImpA
VEWIATRLDSRVRRVPLTKNKLDWLKYEESRRVGYEAEANGNDVRLQARKLAIAEKKCTGEEFDEGARQTTPAAFEKLHKDLESAQEAVAALETACDEKFGKVSPSFSSLRKAISDLQDAIHQYWQLAPETEPEPVVEHATAEGAPAEFTGTLVPVASTPRAAAAERGARTGRGIAEDPIDHEDALRRLNAAATFLRREDRSSPLGYMILRSARWGELRKGGNSLDASLLQPPPTEVRQNLKKLANSGAWAELLDAVEEGMTAPWSRSWLDLQRFAVRACESLGYVDVAASICSELKSLLSAMPDLSSATLADDTPVANAETKAWLQQTILPPPQPVSKETERELETAPVPVAVKRAQEESVPDVYEIALHAATQGRVHEAVEMISQEIMKERSGRGRFTRKVQLARICVTAKRESMAFPILTEIAEEIEARRLEEWEDGELLASALGLLLRCADQNGVDDATRKKIFQKICRLSPVQAFAAMR